MAFDTSNMPMSIQNLSADKTPHKTKLQPVKKDINGNKRDQLMADRDAYLKLLITQLKNQNPNNPTDTQQMTQQIISISQAEQAITSNEYLEKLVNLHQANHRSTAISYIGKEVEYDNSEQLFLGAGIKFSYSINENADRLKIKIKNPSGEVVKTAHANMMQKEKGVHEFFWDGHNDIGKLQAQGKYTIEVEAVDKNNGPIPANTGIRSLVTGVYEDQGNIRLMLANKGIIEVDQVSSINLAIADNSNNESDETNTQEQTTLITN